MTQQTQYRQPKCPSCDAPIDRVFENSHGTYEWNQETGTYTETISGGSMDIKCSECDADLSDVFTQGACNYQAPTPEQYLQQIQEYREEYPVNCYRHCVTCNSTFDAWKYDSREDSGHAGHKLRLLTEKEWLEATEECFADNETLATYVFKPKLYDLLKNGGTFTEDGL